MVEQSTILCIALLMESVLSCLYFFFFPFYSEDKWLLPRDAFMHFIFCVWLI